MQILAFEIKKSGLSSEEFAPYLKDEAYCVHQLQQEGVLRQIWFRGDVKTAVLLLECESVQKTESILSTLPLVKNRLVTFEVIPLVPYSGFARLFSDAL